MHVQDGDDLARILNLPDRAKSAQLDFGEEQSAKELEDLWPELALRIATFLAVEESKHEEACRWMMAKKGKSEDPSPP